MTKSDIHGAKRQESLDTRPPFIMTLEDFHVHTNFCDGNDSPEDIVNEAIKRGMKRLGFSGHSYTEFDTEPCMTFEGTQRYVDEINRLKAKYAGQIEILCGTEQDYYSDMPTVNYDYVIGSVHYVIVDGEYISVDHTPEIFAKLIHRCNDDPYDMAEKYYTLVADVVRKTNADIIGHFDLITKFNEGGKFFDEDNPRYVEACNYALDSLLKTGRPFEINTGAISRGWRKSPYPSAKILKYISSHGGSVILSSDSHSKETLMYHFAECEELARNLGLRIATL